MSFDYNIRCPVCGKSKDCRRSLTTGLYHCVSETDGFSTVSGFRFVREDAIGFGMWRDLAAGFQGGGNFTKSPGGGRGPGKRKSGTDELFRRALKECTPPGDVLALQYEIDPGLALVGGVGDRRQPLEPARQLHEILFPLEKRQRRNGWHRDQADERQSVREG